MIAPLLLVAALVCPPPRPQDAAPAVEVNARAAALAGELEEVLALRELDPEAPEVLERYSVLLGRSGDADGQVAMLLAAIDAYDRAEVDDPKAKAARLDKLTKELLKLEPNVGQLLGYRETYILDLMFALKLYAESQKKLRNALDVGGRVLRSQPTHPGANKIVEDVLARGDESLRKEAERLLGLRELTRPRSFLTRWSGEHRTWEKAGKVQTERYVVYTNIGYDVLQMAARSLEQIAVFYAGFFRADRLGNKGRTDVYLTRTRDEWKTIAEHSITDNTGVLAFILSKVYGELAEGSKQRRNIEFSIYGYDPRDIGQPLESLWPILWHEASHQYMMLASNGRRVPLWINEGMASYFEGARLSPEGEVYVGLPARDRLTSLGSLIQGRRRPLKALIDGEGFLTGEQYSIAWGVVYHLQHWRDEEGNKPLRKCIEKAMEEITKEELTGPELFRRSVLQVLDKDLGEFEEEWVEAMRELVEREAEPLDWAEELVTMGQAHLEAGREVAARECFHDAFLRAPQSPAPLLGFARLAKARWDKSRKDNDLADETLLWARRAHRAALAVEDERTADRAGEIARAVDAAGFRRMDLAERAYRKKLNSLMGRQVEAGRPKTALAIARRFVDDVLGDRRHDALAVELREAGVLSLERPFRAFDGHSLDGLSGSPSLFRIEDGVLIGKGQRPQRTPLFVERPLSPLFRIEGEVELADPNTILALFFSQPSEPVAAGFALRPAAKEGVGPPSTGYQPFDSVPAGSVVGIRESLLVERAGTDYRIDVKAEPMDTPVEAGRAFRFRLSRMSADELVLEIDGTVVARRPISTLGDSASAGLLLYGGDMRLRSLVVVELDRL